MLIDNTPEKEIVKPVHSQLVKEKQKEEVLHKWCVYFDEVTEEIITVTNRPKNNIDYPYLLTTSNDAKDILTGILNPQKYCVIEVSEGYKLVEKSEGIRIKSAENFLSVLPKAKSNKDVNVIFYINSWKMEVNFNQDTLYKMTGRRYHKDIAINAETDGKYDNVVLFLIKKNDPNFLLDTIEIDTKELVQDGYVLYDLHDLRSTCGLGEIDVLTKKIFKSYGVKIQQNFVRAEFTRRYDKKRLIHDVTELTDLVDNSFTIYNQDNEYYIKSNFGQPRDANIYKDVTLYLLQEDNVNILLDTITIPYVEIGYKITSKLKTNVQLENCKIMTKEENRNLTFDFDLQEQTI